MISDDTEVFDGGAVVLDASGAVAGVVVDVQGEEAFGHARLVGYQFDQWRDHVIGPRRPRTVMRRPAGRLMSAVECRGCGASTFRRLALL